ncbi:hypothetical protein Ccrd_008046 [Cynara cardunculus var. scolymus]|uniref:Thionin-like protein 2 n=1 Tax=Cynara cardunculus var. scolymus TaxID=59895 RepID=A0A124SB96_CYNCS|nr:hypothetical protein Ccrd_008046 [Cynara cardunculus var. scolymus]
MERGCIPSIKTSTFVSVLVVLMLLSQAGSTGMYSCWGGCLNQCVLVADKNGEARIPCYWDCSTKCFPRSDQNSTSPTSLSKIPSDQMAKLRSSSASEFPGSTLADDTNTPVNSKSKPRQVGSHKKYYCIIGCSLQSCLMSNHVGADLKTCLVRCNHKCK